MAQFVGDVFGLNAVYEKQLENIENGNFASWPEGATYGYFGGGTGVSGGGETNTISRIDFSNETVSNPGNNLLSAEAYLAAISSDSYGYFGGGTSPPTVSTNTISRIDFFNETVSNPGKNLPTARDELAVTSSNLYGYFGGGGASPGPIAINTITRLDFSNETVSNPSKNLPTARKSLAATSSSSYGYFGGGSPGPTDINTITRLDFSNETVSDPSKNLPTARFALAATSSNLYGYFGGGIPVSPPDAINTITRLDFSNETVNNPGNNLQDITQKLAATSSSFHGYFGGGCDVDGGPARSYNLINRLNFSTETVSTLGFTGASVLPDRTRGLAALSGGQSRLRGNGFKTYGYFIGATSIISRINFSNETVSNPGKNLPAARNEVGGTSNNFYGYIGGGTDPLLVPGILSTITRLDFSNETTNDLNSRLPLPASVLAITSSSSYGYFGGGGGGGGRSTINRLDFSTETVSDPYTKNLPSAREYLTATSSSSYGYFGGSGQTSPNTINTITRLDFSTETVSDPGKNLPTARGNFAATSSNLYGYFGGGVVSGGGKNYISTITRLDFSNETVSDPSKNLPSGRQALSATSSGSFGYFAGGEDDKSVTLCTISRLDFSTETVNNTTNLPTTRTNFASLSNSN